MPVFAVDIKWVSKGGHNAKRSALGYFKINVFKGKCEVEVEHKIIIIIKDLTSEVVFWSRQ